MEVDQSNQQHQHQEGEGGTTDSSKPTSRAAQYHRQANQHLFSQQLEFVSSLSSPSFIANLSHQGLLQDSAFLRYLSQLLHTWSQPQFARFIRYPYSLYFLRCLQHPEFRETVGLEGWDLDVKSRLIDHWATW